MVERTRTKGIRGDHGGNTNKNPKQCNVRLGENISCSKKNGQLDTQLVGIIIDKKCVLILHIVSFPALSYKVGKPHHICNDSIKFLVTEVLDQCEIASGLSAPVCLTELCY